MRSSLGELREDFDLVIDRLDALDSLDSFFGVLLEDGAWRRSL